MSRKGSSLATSQNYTPGFNYKIMGEVIRIIRDEDKKEVVDKPQRAKKSRFSSDVVDIEEAAAVLFERKMTVVRSKMEQVRQLADQIIKMMDGHYFISKLELDRPFDEVNLDLVQTRCMHTERLDDLWLAVTQRLKEWPKKERALLEKVCATESVEREITRFLEEMDYKMAQATIDTGETDWIK